MEELRKQKGLSQKQVADFLRITQQAYSNYANGRREPDYDTLIKISNFYEVSVDYILGQSDDPSPSNKKNTVGTKPPDNKKSDSNEQEPDDEVDETESYVAYRRAPVPVVDEDELYRQELIKGLIDRISKIDDFELLKSMRDYSEFILAKRNQNGR